MTERGKNALTQTKDSLTLGPSDIRWDGKDLALTINEVAAPLPRRVRGTIRLTLDAVTTSAFALDTQGRHIWHPIAPHARAQVQFDSPALNWSGNAYCDSNWGTEPLEDGFRSWDWCRAALPDGAGVYYDAILKSGDTKRMALRFDTSGNPQERPCPAPMPLSTSPIWRMPRSVPADKQTEPETLQMLENTPFYTRSHIAVPFDGERVTAVHESLDLRRFSNPVVRCLLPFRMPRRG